MGPASFGKLGVQHFSSAKPLASYRGLTLRASRFGPAGSDVRGLALVRSRAQRRGRVSTACNVKFAAVCGAILGERCRW